MTGVPGKCPDGGTCHHGCDLVCNRVREAGPLSGVYPGDTWPAVVVRKHTPPMALADLVEMVDPRTWDEPVRAVTPHGSFLFDIVGATWEHGAVHLRLREVAVPCPECAAGKCGNCADDTWDTVRDEPTRCPCSLLAHPRRTA